MTRSIEPAMIKWLDKKLAGNGLAQEAIKRKDARLLFRLAMEACVGVREAGGNNRGPLVELMQETLGSAGREPWCMSLVQTCLAYAEEKCRVTSPIHASEHCLTVWNNTPSKLRVKRIPAPGAIIIWRHGTSAAGHTGSVCDVSGKTMRAVEGNTESGNAGGQVQRDGGGVYFTSRALAGTGKMRVVGFLKPFA